MEVMGGGVGVRDGATGDGNTSQGDVAGGKNGVARNTIITIIGGKYLV